MTLLNEDSRNERSIINYRTNPTKVCETGRGWWLKVIIGSTATLQSFSVLEMVSGGVLYAEKLNDLAMIIP
ncbi:MAG: hypothetical protein LBS54_03125 [Dysgonamonadaceae bacterium]|jgi:hypothetical protein|nr:hypothetical protein [Dysgonamonadaceae bacterium]